MDRIKSLKYNPQNTKIAVIGGGNIGTQFACMSASKGYTVKIHSTKPEKYDCELEIINEASEITCGRVACVTADIAEAVRGCNIIIVTHPAFQLKKTADKLLPYVSSETNICVLPGTGGAEFAFRECIRKGATLFGLQRVPSVARLEEYGKRVRCEGLRSELFLASIPENKANDLAEFMGALFGIKCTVLPNYLSVTLTPSNPILHTTRLCTLFADYAPGKVYDRNPLFYGEWSDASSELLIACDEELQQMCRALDQMDLSKVLSLKIHYESPDVRALTNKMSSIKSLHNLSSPMIQVEGGWIPDFNSRYFTADFPYGLAIIESLADILGFEVPNIRSTMDWYRDVTGDVSRLELAEYGISTINDIYALYGNNPECSK